MLSTPFAVGLTSNEINSWPVWQLTTATTLSSICPAVFWTSEPRRRRSNLPRCCCQCRPPPPPSSSNGVTSSFSILPTHSTFSPKTPTTTVEEGLTSQCCCCCCCLSGSKRLKEEGIWLIVCQGWVFWSLCRCLQRLWLIWPLILVYFWFVQDLNVSYHAATLFAEAFWSLSIHFSVREAKGI